jgi:hypothetical protein
MESEGSLRVHRRLPSVPVLSQIIPVHTFPSYFLKTHFNLILPQMLRFSKWYSVQRGNVVDGKVLRKRCETKYNIALFLSGSQSKVVR